jgi:MinD-like ATPase involved in chromosome partitioning or flagellar assembly
MYVVTFYSFKGGVGRTMAMVNVAAELARTGRRVLLVDFDLVAPGLCEFDLLDPEIRTPGLVEFVSDYLVDHIVPDVKNYIHRSNRFSETADRLWVMPAGCQKNSNYQSLFTAINWNDLYEEHDGYLLMEDLRSQWESAIHPDYVFVDSRTGYTDIAGICTRQLPDAVCLLFTLNKQNLTGLTRITSEIKAQVFAPELRQPLLHFVASNIPNLDDEENVISKALGNFSEQLAYVKPATIIHHHDSLALVNEAIFTLQFPKSALATQYRTLAEEITKPNLADRYTAISFVSTLIRDYSANRELIDLGDSDSKIKLIESIFAKDKDILFLVSRARRLLGNVEESKILLDAAIQMGLNTSQAFLDRILLRMNEPDRNPEALWEDLNRILLMGEGVPVGDLLWCVRLARMMGKFATDEFANSPAVSGLDAEQLIYFAGKLEDSETGLELTLNLMLRALSERTLSIEQMNSALGYISLVYIHQGELDSAVDAMLKITTVDVARISMPLAFNLGMAKHWIGHSDSNVYFQRTLELYAQRESIADLNVFQCLSFAYWALGNKVASLETLQRARASLKENRHQNFSCWRYMEVAPAALEADLDEMERLYLGENILPRFISGRSRKLFT